MLRGRVLDGPASCCGVTYARVRTSAPCPPARVNLRDMICVPSHVIPDLLHCFAVIQNDLSGLKRTPARVRLQ